MGAESSAFTTMLFKGTLKSTLVVALVRRGGVVVGGLGIYLPRNRMAEKPNDKPKHLRWDPARRVRKAAQMQGNRNAASSKFSQDLMADFGDDPEIKKWIEENAGKLDSPNPDGSLPLSDDQITEGDSHGPRKDYGDERSIFIPKAE
jgi:hypothetical protein